MSYTIKDALVISSMIAAVGYGIYSFNSERKWHFFVTDAEIKTIAAAEFYNQMNQYMKLCQEPNTFAYPPSDCPASQMDIKKLRDEISSDQYAQQVRNAQFQNWIYNHR